MSKSVTRFRIRPNYPNWVVERERQWTVNRRIIDVKGPKWVGKILDFFGLAASHYEDVPVESDWTVVRVYSRFQDAEKYVLDRIKAAEEEASEAPLFNSQPTVYYPKERTLADAIAERNEAARKVLHYSHWHHKKSGHDYIVQGFVIRESDLEVMVVYRAPDQWGDSMVQWSRPYKEFIDGRFVKKDGK